MAPNPEIADTESLADDILRGAETIGAFIGLPPRRAFYLLQLGLIDATKEGRVWTSAKSRLRKQYLEVQYRPPPREPVAELTMAKPRHVAPKAPKRKRVA